jgi:hypothetical protein
MYQQYAVSSTPVRIAVTTGTEIQALDQAVRFHDDGVAPTAEQGFQIAAGATYRHRTAPGELQIISESGTAEVNILVK